MEVIIFECHQGNEMQLLEDMHNFVNSGVKILNIIPWTVGVDTWFMVMYESE